MWKARIRQILLWSIMSIAMVASIAFSSKKHSDRRINDLIINIDNSYENYFVDIDDVKSMINSEDATYLLTADLGDLDLKLIEDRVQTNDYVSDVEAFLDHHGNLVISIAQCRPIARIFDPSGPDYYISDQGLIIPVSNKYTARVPLILYEQKPASLKDSAASLSGTELFRLLTHIHQNKFWSSQIAQININKEGELIIEAQVSKQKILFGTADDFGDKLRRLEVFYKEILPVKGWNTYESVNLKFANQIVCE